MADLSCSRTNRKRSSFATKHFQRKSLKHFDLHPPLKGLVSFVARIITCKGRCWVKLQTQTQTHSPSTVTLAAHARRGLNLPCLYRLYLTLHRSTTFVMAVHNCTWLYNGSTQVDSTTLYYGSTLPYMTLLHSTMAQLDSTFLYYTLLWLYNGSPWLYSTLPCLYYIVPYLAILDSSSVYNTTIALLGSTWLFYTLPWLYYILPWLYLPLHDSTTFYYGST